MTNSQKIKRMSRLTKSQRNARKTIYGEWLDVICNSYLMFDSRRGLAEVSGYRSLNNYKPLSYISDPVKQEMLYLWLAKIQETEIYNFSGDEFSLDTFLATYKYTSIFYEDRLKRSTVLSSAHVDNIYDMLDYCFGMKSAAEINRYVRDYFKVEHVPNIRDQEAISKWKKEKHHVRIRPDNTDIPLLVLLILRIIPPYNSQQGVGNKKRGRDGGRYVNIKSECQRVQTFLNGYILRHELFDEIPYDICFYYDEPEITENVNRIWLYFYFSKSLMKFISQSTILYEQNNLCKKTNPTIRKETHISKFKTEILSIKRHEVEVFSPARELIYGINTEAHPILKKLTITSPCEVIELLSIRQIVFPSLGINLYINDELRSGSIKQRGLTKEDIEAFKCD